MPTTRFSRGWAAVLLVLLSGPGAGCSSDASGDGVDAGGGADAAPPTCPDDPAVPGSIAFDGTSAQVSMGVAPELGLATFTVEAWVRRDGPGKTFNTGVGGLTLVPIAGKGRGEGDGSNVDCNYAFGFWGDVLGADFEDMASGANHPITGKTAIAPGEWHHVAVTYDGTTWRLYVDGVVDAKRQVDAMPRADSIQHFGVGTSYNSKGVAGGFLDGAVDELRVWNRARTKTEIAGDMYRTVTSGDGLIGRWSFDGADGANDSAGANDGTIDGAELIEDGAVLDRGAPPAATEATPADGAMVPAGDVDLDVAVDDPDSDPLLVTFHVRELGEGDDFTIVVLPDTQVYTIKGKGLEHFYYDQTQWVRDHRNDYNIAAVIHNGDIVNDGDRLPYEWTVADKAMGTLETPEDGLPDGVPYGVSVGNHDQTPNGSADDTKSFNQHFGVDRFAGRAYYGGHYKKDNDENWITFSAGGLDFVLVSLQYNTSPDPAVQAWARSIFDMHPKSFGILNTHYLLTHTGAFSAQGKAIYAALRDAQNVQLMTCGHIGAEARRTDVFKDHPIHSMLADFQFEAGGGSAKMRIWEFSPRANELTVRTYSPSLDKWYTGENSEFTLPVDLSGVGGSFDDEPTVTPSGGRAGTRLTGLEAGKTYEWYATVEDCSHATRTPVHRFTTVSSAAADRQRPQQEPTPAERAKQVRNPPPSPAGTAVPIAD